MQVLVIGGTGPTGHFIVERLHSRGDRVSMLHSGRHEIPETPAAVEHIHTDAYDGDALRTALEGRRFDLCIATYGRLRAIAEVLQGRVGRLISIGGQPAYRGYTNPELWQPHGLPVPTAEDAPLIADPAEDDKGYRIVRTEQRVFELHPDATHFRYPYVYGPYQLVPREWCIVRRILDGRPSIILPDGGLSLHSFGYAENLAHAVMLAVEQPDAAAGQIFNAADATTFTLRQVVEAIAAALGHDWEIINLPWELATPARPLLMQPWTTHRVMDISKLQQRLGYRDLVPPAIGLARTAQWLVANPPARGGMEEQVLQDPFDYAAEDQLVAAWRRLRADWPSVRFTEEPGFTLSYSGPGGRARSNPAFE